MKKTILIIEDENEIREIEKAYLEKEEYKVLEAVDGKAGLKVFENQPVDLIVLDLNLPELDGLEVCRQIRKKSGVPIIMVTARTKEIDEIIGFDCGADDYVKKPFSPKVLLKRIAVLLKRPPSNPAKISIGEIEINTENMKVTKNKKTVDLTTVQFNIFYSLVAEKGKVFTRDEIMDKGYPDHLPPDIYDRTIDCHIKNIRKKIEDDPANPEIILTVRGVGYKANEDL